MAPANSAGAMVHCVHTLTSRRLGSAESSPDAAEARIRPTGVVDAALRFLPVFLPTKRGQVEEVVGAAHLFGAAAEARVGVEDLVAVAQEGAQAGVLERMVLREGRVLLGRAEQ